MCKIRDVNELYALADKCARAEEGRKLPGENTEAGGSDSEDAAPARKNRRWNNRKKKGKDVLVVEKSGNGGGAKKATFICSPRRKESLCASTFRDSATCSTTSQTSTLPR